MSPRKRKQLSPQEVFDRQTAAFHKLHQELIDEYSRKEPNWISLTVLDQARRALMELRVKLENPMETEVTWSAPFVELRFPAAFDFDTGRSVPAVEMTPEDFAEETFESEKKSQAFAEKWAEGFRYDRDYVVLETITRRCAFFKKGNEYSLHVREGVEEALGAMPEEKRKAELARMYEPVTFGTADVVAEEGELDEEGRPASLEVAENLKRRAERDLGPFLSFEVEREKESFSGSVVIAFHPLVVDENERRAYFSVVVGLRFEPWISGLEFESWPKEERDGLWESLFGELDRAEKELTVWGWKLPEDEEQKAATSQTSTIPSPVVVAPSRERVEVMGRVPVPRRAAKSAQAYALVRGLGRMFAGYSKVADLDLRGKTVTDEAEALFWASLEETLDKLEPDGWRLDRNGSAVLTLRGMNEKEARVAWNRVTRALNAGEGGPGLEVAPPFFEDRTRFESGNVVKETRLVFWPEETLRDRERGEPPPVRFRRESSPGYVALLERHGPRPYFADGWYWVPRGHEREGFRIGGLSTLLFPEGRAALERLAKRKVTDTETELQRIFREPSLFHAEDDRAARDLRDAIRRTKDWLQRLSVYDIGQDLVLCIFEAFHRQRNAWIGQRVRLADGREVETKPWRIIRLDPDGLAVRLDLKRKWGKDWRHRLFEKLETLTTFERQTRTRTGRKVDVGDRFLLRVIDGRRGVNEGTAPETDSGLGLTRLLRQAGAFPLDVFFVDVSVDFMERLVTWVVDEEGTVRWGLDAARAAERAALTAGNKRARKDAKEKLQEARERPTYDHSPRLLTLGNLEDWPLERRTLTYVLLQEETPNFERYRDSKGRSRKRPKSNRRGGKRRLVSIDGRDFVACNGSHGNGYKVRTWIDKAVYEKRTGPGGGVQAFENFARDLEDLSDALELRLELVHAGETRRDGQALEVLKSYRENPPGAYALKLKAYLPANLEERLGDRLREAGIETVDEAEPVDPLHKATRPGGLTPTDLRTARKRAGWKQEELAAKVGVSKMAVSSWETARRPIPTDRERRLWDLLEAYVPGRSSKPETLRKTRPVNPKLSESSRQ